MLNQKLQQKLLQKLSPQQIQLIKLLEIPTMELEQRIKKEIEENPVLEEGEADDDYDEDINITDDGEIEIEVTRKEEEDGNIDDDNDNEAEREDNEFSLEDFVEEDYEDIPDYKLSVNNNSKDDKKSDTPFAIGATFHEYLVSQLGMQSISLEQRQISEYIIGNIDDDGYLRRSVEDIVDDLAFLQNVTVTEEEIFKLVMMIQRLDPPGICARDLQECLVLQVSRKLGNKKEDTGLKLALQILKEMFNEFTKKHYDKIIARLNITEKELKLAIDEILKLTPKPGGSFSPEQDKDFQHIVPDFILEVSNGELQLSLNSKNAPDLRINREYTKMLQAFTDAKKKRTRSDKDAIVFVKQKLDSAKWFIDAIQQRQNTLMVTMQAIVDYQQRYFFDGDEKLLHPMILKDIAEITGLDISTISRVANSKYIQTHFGIYPVKYFFSEGMETSSGEEVSTREIKKILQDCIGAESKRRPLTDEKLAEILQEKGYNIARRTVAKYREQLNIPVARLRKML